MQSIWVACFSHRSIYHTVYNNVRPSFQHVSSFILLLVSPSHHFRYAPYSPQQRLHVIRLLPYSCWCPQYLYVTWYHISYNSGFCFILMAMPVYFLLRKTYYSLISRLLLQWSPCISLAFSLTTYSPLSSPSLTLFFPHTFLSSFWTRKLNIWRTAHLGKLLLCFGCLSSEAGREQAIVKQVIESAANAQSCKHLRIGWAGMMDHTEVQDSSRQAKWTRRGKWQGVC